MGIETKKQAKFIATYLKEHRRRKSPLSDEELIEKAVDIVDRFDPRIELAFNVQKSICTVMSIQGIHLTEDIPNVVVDKVFACAIQGALLLKSDIYTLTNSNDAKDAVSEIILLLIAHGWLELDEPRQVTTITFELDDLNKLGDFELYSTIERTDI